jgi:hypothetical protein
MVMQASAVVRMANQRQYRMRASLCRHELFCEEGRGVYRFLTKRWRIAARLPHIKRCCVRESCSVLG